jgi:hypothetical protein
MFYIVCAILEYPHVTFSEIISCTFNGNSLNFATKLYPKKIPRIFVAQISIQQKPIHIDCFVFIFLYFFNNYNFL